MMTGCLDWAVAGHALQGEVESGDHCLVTPRADGVLVAALDGVGHGEAAARAARRAAATIQAHRDETLLSLTALCHEALVGWRGVVMSLARFVPKDRTMVWLGVGNVQGWLLRSAPQKDCEHLVTRPGLVGDRLPPLMASLLPVSPGDLLVFSTDGVSDWERESVVASDPPQAIADRLLSCYAKRDDDALVFVGRYLPS
jgi:hypothetical protein